MKRVQHTVYGGLIVGNQIRRLIFLSFAQNPHRWKMYVKHEGFLLLEGDPPREREVTTWFASLWALALLQTDQSGDAVKSHIECSLDVMYRFTTLWKKQSKTEIMRCLEMPLCPTRKIKKWREIEIIWRFKDQEGAYERCPWASYI